MNELFTKLCGLNPTPYERGLRPAYDFWRKIDVFPFDRYNIHSNFNVNLGTICF